MNGQLTTSKKILLGVQHLFAMFGATVLVPALTGLNPSIALVSAGIGTLLFHLITQHKVPVFVGSSFAYIAALQIVVERKGIPYAQGGIIVSSLIYLALAALVRLVGTEKVRAFFPPIVVGPVVVVIGINLAPVGIAGASANWWISLFVLAVIIAMTCFAKGFFQLIPILVGLVAGYLVCILCDLAGIFPDQLVDWSQVRDASWFLSPSLFTLPKFDLEAIMLIAPIAVVTFMEHIGDITTNGSVVGRDFFKDPGLHRTLAGDGVASAVAGLIGGPANTTYSENTGVLAVTRVYETGVLKIAAVFAIALGMLGKFGAVLGSIPEAVKGGMSIMLFGMIAAVGMRTLIEARLDFKQSRNLIICGSILVFGLGLADGVEISWLAFAVMALAAAVSLFLKKLLPLAGGLAAVFVLEVLLRISTGGLNFSGLFIAVLVGMLANKILPENV